MANKRLPLALFILTSLSLLGQLGAKTVKLTFLQLNDVYEVSPVSGGTLGGLARIQTLIKELKAENPNTYTVLAGDLFSPSAIGTATYKGRPLAGRQMVDLLNKMDWDYFIFGNHEFDLEEQDMRARCEEARFPIIADNVLDQNGKPFPNSKTKVKLEVEGITIGFIGVTMTNFDHPYSKISDPITKAKEVAQYWKEQNADIIIAITHQDINDDVKLIVDEPAINMLMGGHEHENYYEKRGLNFTPITKADANAKTAFIHRLTYETETKELAIKSELVIVNKSIKSDAAIQKAADEWTEIAFKAFEANGYTPKKLICNSTEVLDGTEASVRSHQTALTELITDGFLAAYPEADLSIMNGGSIRIDDTLMPGPIIEFDIMRISPFGGDICLVEMSGKTLIRTLTQGEANVGIGSYLQHSNVEKQGDTWTVKGTPIKEEQTYKIAANAYLMDHGDANLEFLPNEITKTDTPNKEFFQVVIDQFKREFPN